LAGTRGVLAGYSAKKKQIIDVYPLAILLPFIQLITVGISYFRWYFWYELNNEKA